MKKKHRAALVVTLFTTAASQGAIIFQGDWLYGTITPTLVITEAITFQINRSGAIAVIVFDNALSNDDETQTEVFTQEGAPLSIAIDEINQTIGLYNIHVSLGESLGDMDPQDTFLNLLARIPVKDEESFTINPNTIIFTPNPHWNPELQNGYTFTGNVFLADMDFNRLSKFPPPDAIPEPSAALLGLLGAGFFLRRKRF